MKNVLRSMVVLGVVLCSFDAFPWGATGHRIVGEFAQRDLTKKVGHDCVKLLENMNLSDEANFLDEERIDPDYGPVAVLHYVSIDDQYQSYKDSPKNPNGDIVQALTLVYSYLKSGNPDDLKPLPILAKLVKDKETAIIFLVHLVGDIHQPLHVGRSTDAGGNAVKVNFMGQITNLHSVWDEGMIDGSKLSFTEFTAYLERLKKNIPPETIKSWENEDFASWADETLQVRKSIVYSYPDDQPAPEAGQPAPIPVLSYKYEAATKPSLDQQLIKAGVRLAYLLSQVVK